MPVNHYENFPVASLLLPARYRPAVEAIYHFARSADDIADEGDAPPAERLASLDQYRGELTALASGQPCRLAACQCLAPHIRAFSLPLQPFHDLLDAFSQDVVKTRYADFPELLDYCSRSANPVGRLVLALYGRNDEPSLRQSDAICTALQLANFLQDVGVDWGKDRIYLPQDELRRFGIAEEAIAEGRWSPEWAALMDLQVDRARGLLRQGAPLVHSLPGRIGWELRLVVQGGLTILQKVQHIRGRVFSQRPTLAKTDIPGMLWRSLWL